MAVEVLKDGEFQEKLSNADRIAVKYYADWCGSCRLFAPKFRRLSEDDRFKDISFIDINAEQNPAARKLAVVTNLPFFAIFKDGELVEGMATNKEDMVVEMLTKLQ
jgi:thiol-disulfide isomerase/thioredoxin